MERLVPRRQIQPEVGDVVITRERLPKVNPYLSEVPWRYRVAVYPEPRGHTFTGFAPAASEAEELASTRRARVLYIEMQSATLLADYRRSRGQ